MQDRDFPLAINIILFRFGYIIITIYNCSNFKKHRVNAKYLLRLLAVCCAAALLFFNVDSFITELRDRVKSVPTANEGVVYEIVRFALAHFIFQLAIYGTFLFGGYKRGYVCDVEKCPRCPLLSGKHPATWKVDLLEYQVVAMTLLYPMLYTTAMTQIWFDRTDFGAHFFHSSSLISIATNANASVPCGAAIS